MLRESFAILGVCILLVYVFVRRKHFGYALATLPIVAIPLLHLVIRGVLRLSNGAFFGVRPAIVTAFVDVVAIGVSCLLTVVFSRRIQTTRMRRAYQIVVVAYCLILGWAYVFNSLSPIL